MAIKKVVRKLFKIGYFIVLIFCAGHILPTPELYINYEMAKKLALFINDNESADSMYDAYSYIDLIILLIISTVFYLATMTLIKKIRRK